MCSLLSLSLSEDCTVFFRRTSFSSNLFFVDVVDVDVEERVVTIPGAAGSFLSNEEGWRYAVDAELIAFPGNRHNNTS